MRAPEPIAAAGARIDVDFGQLRQLAQQLRDVAGCLDGRANLASAELDIDLLGHLRVLDQDWSRHRRQLQSFLLDTAAAVAQIVAQYEKTDDMIATAATP
ncbi:MAG TPA: hypothetical protein VHO01_10120 [Jatrophihabitans sp.]|nr:hypothetical protein [Jatrophihabitans sp.]